MRLRLFRHTTRQRELDDERQPMKRFESTNAGGERRDIPPTGATATRLREAESEWPWWLSPPTTEAAGEEEVSRRWALWQDESDEEDEPDEPTSPPAA